MGERNAGPLTMIDYDLYDLMMLMINPLGIHYLILKPLQGFGSALPSGSGEGLWVFTDTSTPSNKRGICRS